MERWWSMMTAFQPARCFPDRLGSDLRAQGHSRCMASFAGHCRASALYLFDDAPRVVGRGSWYAAYAGTARLPIPRQTASARRQLRFSRTGSSISLSNYLPIASTSERSWAACTPRQASIVTSAGPFTRGPIRGCSRQGSSMRPIRRARTRSTAFWRGCTSTGRSSTTPEWIGSGHRRPWELTLHHLSVSEILCAARRHEGVTCAPAWANPSRHKLGLPEFRGPDSGRATRLHGERAHLARPLQFKPELFPRGPRCASP